MSRRVTGVWFPAIRTGGGADVFTVRLAEALAKRGLRTQVTWLPLRAEYAPWTVGVPAAPAWADVVHVNTWLPPRFLPIGLPVVATVHHCVHDPSLRRYKGMLRRAYHEYWVASNERSVAKRARVLTAVSAFASASASQVLGGAELEVVHNGVDVNRFRPGRRSEQARFRLLYVGKWSLLKGVDMLPPIMRRLGPEFELHYTGPGARADTALEHAGAPVLDIGRLESSEAVASAMQDADALLFPSRVEGFGLVVAEAMACGLPVIATNGSALPELVQEGITGFLCAQDDVEAFVDAARRLAGDKVLQVSMGRNARLRATQRFSIERMVEAYAQIYERCTRM